jgi:hypothetical protein
MKRRARWGRGHRRPRLLLQRITLARRRHRPCSRGAGRGMAEACRSIIRAKQAAGRCCGNNARLCLGEDGFKAVIQVVAGRRRGPRRHEGCHVHPAGPCNHGTLNAWPPPYQHCSLDAGRRGVRQRCCGGSALHCPECGEVGSCRGDCRRGSCCPAPHRSRGCGCSQDGRAGGGTAGCSGRLPNRCISGCSCHCATASSCRCD